MDRLLGVLTHSIPGIKQDSIRKLGNFIARHRGLLQLGYRLAVVVLSLLNEPAGLLPTQAGMGIGDEQGYKGKANQT